MYIILSIVKVKGIVTLVALTACLLSLVALVRLWRTDSHSSAGERWSGGQGQGGAHCSGIRSKIDSRMFLPQAFVGYDSQEEPLRDLPSSITMSPWTPFSQRYVSHKQQPHWRTSGMWFILQGILVDQQWSRHSNHCWATYTGRLLYSSQ